MTHIVDTLIEERAEQLMTRPRLWTFIRKFLYPVLGYWLGEAMAAHRSQETGRSTVPLLSTRAAVARPAGAGALSGRPLASLGDSPAPARSTARRSGRVARGVSVIGS